MPQKFDPLIYKNKKTIYVSLEGYKGISNIWDWSKTKKRYVRRNFGNKFYAVKRLGPKQVAKCFANLNQANQWKLQDISEHFEEDETNIKFTDLLTRYFNKKESEIRITTFETYKSKVKHLAFFEKFLVCEITPKVIDQWLILLKSPNYLKGQHNSRLTYKHELSLLRQILDYYAEYICEDNSYSIPIKKRHRQDYVVDKVKNELAKSKNKTKFLSRKSFQQFLSELSSLCSKKLVDENYYLLALFQSATGVRIGEAAALRWEDIDLGSKQAFVHRNVCWSKAKGRETFISNLTKTGESRVIFLPAPLVQELRKWSLKSGRSKGLVFSHEGLTPLEYRKIQYRYDKALNNIGSDWRGTHILRHSFATDFLEKTGESKALQGQLGHKTAEQTNHYAKITENLKKGAMNKYEDTFIDLESEQKQKC